MYSCGQNLRLHLLKVRDLRLELAKTIPFLDGPSLNFLKISVRSPPWFLDFLLRIGQDHTSIKKKISAHEIFCKAGKSENK